MKKLTDEVIFLKSLENFSTLFLEYGGNQKFQFICEKCNHSQTLPKKRIKKLQSLKCTKCRRKETNLQKYGVENIFQDKETITFETLYKEFCNFDLAYNSTLIPFTIAPLEESQELKIEEFDDYVVQYRQMIMYVKTMIRTIKKGSIQPFNNSYSKKLNEKIKASEEFYNDIMTVRANEKELVEKLQTAHYAYLIICRCLNTVIRMYNKSAKEKGFPTIDELNEIPEPKSFDFTSINLQSCIDEYDKKINTLLS